MKQDLEKYLKENRLKLDADNPDDESIWAGIQGGMDKKKYTLPQWFWKVAAIFIFLVSATYFILNETQNKQVVVLTLADVSQELGSQENELKKMVDLKWEEVKPLLEDGSSDLQFLLDEMKSLDEIYETYQNDLAKIGPNEDIVNAMLDYYQKKIKILNRLLHEIQKQDSHENNISI